MNDQYVEKKLLYLVGLSLAIHAALFALLYHLPGERKQEVREPVMVELQDLPAPRDIPRPEKPAVARGGSERRRVPKETAPRGEDRRTTRPMPERVIPSPHPYERRVPPGMPPAAPPRRPSREPAGEILIKPRPEKPVDIAKLFPGADTAAKLEETYRKKYLNEVQEGGSTFLNTDDILFGSFLRRFETAVYGVWRYPREAVQLGVEGVTPVRITFNRNGEIEKVVLLESSGSTLLDEEVLRTLRAVGPIGKFPRGYDKDTFNLIAFFHYGIVRGNVRGVLR